jgi:hypothetical protein
MARRQAQQSLSSIDDSAEHIVWGRTCSTCLTYYSKIEENTKSEKYIPDHVYSWIALVTGLLSPCGLLDSLFIICKQYMNVM